MVAQIEAGTKTIRPSGNRVLVKPEDAKEKTKGGILLPDTAKEKPQTARIIALGPGRRAENGDLIALVGYEKNDLVLLQRYSGTEVVIDGEPHLIVDADEILGTIVEEG
jgi:chaperonin GroES